ncbi:MAG TPA: fasciclin domain-containing protein [Lacibacter sp.]|nr:fasciclin domain-containing protein [Lacibacter sp.]
MKLILNKWRSLLAVALGTTVMISCNKDIEAPVPNPTPAVPQGSTIADIVNTNANYTLLKHAVTRANNAGINAALANRTGIYTVFAPDNAAFGRLGITSTAIIDALFTPAQLVQILNYHIIPGQAYTSAVIPTTFPNIQLPTAFIIPAPNTNPLVRFSSFPAKRGGTAWVNNAPVAAADIPAANGVIHGIALPLLPPSRVLLDTIARDPDFSFLVAAIVRADSDLPSTSTSRFQYALGEPLANLTVFAPTNDAFRALINALSGGAIPTNAPDATFVGFINTLPPTTLKGIIAYHVLGQRAFNVNFPTTATSYPTLLNGSVPTHPGVSVTATLNSGFGAGLSVKGVMNATAATAAGTAAGFDRQAINGVFYKINQVLLPQ